MENEGLIKRIELFLEDENWDKAIDYCERVLDEDPECAKAYLYELLAELKVTTKDELKNCAQPFDDLNSCKKASRFDSSLAEELGNYNEFIRNRNEISHKEQQYETSKHLMYDNSVSSYEKAICGFETIIDWKDSKEKIEECKNKIEELNESAKRLEEERKLREEENRVIKAKK